MSFFGVPAIKIFAKEIVECNPKQNLVPPFPTHTRLVLIGIRS